MRRHLAAVGMVALSLTLLGGACTRRQERRVEKTWERATGHAVNLNTASQKELSALPGLTDDDAARIIANRPYGSTNDLLRKKVIGKNKYDQIQDMVYVRQ